MIVATNEDITFMVSFTAPEMGAILGAAFFAAVSHGSRLHPMMRLAFAALSAMVAYFGLKLLGIN